MVREETWGKVNVVSRREDHLDRTYGAHYLEIYAQDRIRFIEEIGSYNPAHVEKFEEFLKAYEGRAR